MRRLPSGLPGLGVRRVAGAGHARGASAVRAGPGAGGRGEGRSCPAAGAEASAGALATVGLGDPALRERHPRDLSGGEKQRLALAIVLDGIGEDPNHDAVVVCLDEPTRGMDRRRKDELAALLSELDAAVLV